MSGSTAWLVAAWLAALIGSYLMARRLGWLGPAAEVALTERDARQRRAALCWEQVFRDAGWGVVVGSADGQRLELVNPEFARMHGFTVEELQGAPLLHVFAPSVRDGVAEQIRIAQGQGRHRFESLHLRRDGSEFPVLVDVSAVRDESGAVQCRVVNVQDITDQVERRQALLRNEQALRQAKDFLEMTFEAAAVGMAVIGADGCVQRANAAFGALVGRSAAQWSTVGFIELLAPADRVAHASCWEALRRGELRACQKDVRLLRPDGSEAAVTLAVRVLRPGPGDGQLFIVQALDTAESQRVQQALRASEHRLANAQRIARLGDWEWDLRAGSVQCSAEASRLLGLGPQAQALSAEVFLGCVHAADRPALEAALEAARDDSRPVAVDHRMGAGGATVVHQQAEPEFDTAGRVARLVGTLQDITERKRAELALEQSQRQLRDLAAHVDALVEEERKHIARDVHDELGQLLTALRMDLSLMRSRLAGDAGLCQQVDKMRSMVDHTLMVVRHVASNLRPAALDLGLVPALEWLAEDFALRWEIPCQLNVEGEIPALPESRATALFRVVQESLTNVARHARATQVSIELARRDDCIALAVRDDGVGFDAPQARARGRGFGLLGMEERMIKMGGRFELHSGRGGTMVRIEMSVV